MDYQCDTLTCAESNRAASRKFYHYFIAPISLTNKSIEAETMLTGKPSRSLLPQDIPQMLHRSPSGAKRRIRQKREELGTRPSPFLSPSSSSISSTVSDDSQYRNLVGSGDFQSILPAEEEKPPIPTPRLSLPLSTSMSSLELSTAGFSQQTAKPTVEVHPMPAETTFSSSQNTSIEVEYYKHKPKPAVPAKPKGLLIDHMNRSTSMQSLSSPVTQTTSTFLNTFMMTPSLINIHQGFQNPDLGSQEFAKLENARNENIKKVENNLIDFRKEKHAIESEIEEIDRIGSRLLSIIERTDRPLFNKVRKNLENKKEVIEIETKLSLQMSKIQDRLKDGSLEKNVATFEDSRLRKRFQETGFLKSLYERRDKDLEKELAKIFNHEELSRWRKYKDISHRLCRDENTVEYNIRESTMKLDVLNHSSRK